MPSISYFEIVGKIIEKNIEGIQQSKNISRDDILHQMFNQIVAIYKQYRTGRKPRIDYTDPICRLAYMYSYVASRAGLISYIFEWDDELKNHLHTISNKQGRIQICAFGGGPGTELLGLASWAEKSDFNTFFDLDFLLLDREQHWSDSWYPLKYQLDNYLKTNHGANSRNWPVSC